MKRVAREIGGGKKQAVFDSIKCASLKLFADTGRKEKLSEMVKLKILPFNGTFSVFWLQNSSNKRHR